MDWVARAVRIVPVRRVTVQLHLMAWRGAAVTSSYLAALRLSQVHVSYVLLRTGWGALRVQVLPALRGTARPAARIPALETSTCTAAALQVKANVRRA